jgi:hypothetical protein
MVKNSCNDLLINGRGGKVVISVPPKPSSFLLTALNECLPGAVWCLIIGFMPMVVNFEPFSSITFEDYWAYAWAGSALYIIISKLFTAYKHNYLRWKVKILDDVIEIDGRQFEKSHVTAWHTDCKTAPNLSHVGFNYKNKIIALSPALTKNNSSHFLQLYNDHAWQNIYFA